MLSSAKTWIITTATFFLISALIFCAEDAYYYKGPATKLDGLFPALVSYQDIHTKRRTARIVFADGLPDFLKQAPRHSFLVDVDREPAMLKAVAAEKGQRDLLSGPGSFSVKRLPDGKQYLRVTGTWGDSAIPHIESAWYITDGRSIYPRYRYCQFYPGHIVFAAWQGFIATAVLIAIWTVSHNVYNAREQ